ncbi:hypothetical protein ID866_9400 [Astraeus odoratus]|nr:hypothetical protein ID866_9400 [Astraeus odoratus]
MAELERTRTDGEMRSRDLCAKLEASEASVKSLKEAIAVNEEAEDEHEALLKAKDAEIVLMQERIERIGADLDLERRELVTQIDELRQAGQETIALYEERLSAADNQRYELEDRIMVLEERARRTAAPISPGVAPPRVTATEIDNETLRDQVQHLQKKLSVVEDALEDVRASSEREEACMREKIRRLKEREDEMRNELNEGRKNVEHILKAEAQAKRRIEEVEEALRESTLALQNAQAEIETLRSDAAAADAGVKGDGDTSQDHASTSCQAAAERPGLMQEDRELRDTEEITGLKHIVQELQKQLTAVTQHNKLLESENRLLITEAEQLRRGSRDLVPVRAQSTYDPQALDSGDEHTLISLDLRGVYERVYANNLRQQK